MPEEIMLVNPRRRRAKARALTVRPGYVLSKNPRRRHRRRTSGRIAYVANPRRRYRSNPLAIGGRGIGSFASKGVMLGVGGAAAALILPKMIDKKSRGWRNVLGAGLASIGIGSVLGPTAFFGGAVITGLKALQQLLGKRRGISGDEEELLGQEEEDILGGLDSELAAIEGDLSEAIGQEEDVWA